MSCKTPILRAVFDSPTVQAVDENGTINLPEVTSNSKCASVSGGTITIRSAGDYEVQFNGTFVATAAGPLEVQMFRNGSPVPGAHAIGQAAAVGDNVPLAFNALVSVECCNSDTVSFRVLDATSVRIANAIVTETL